MKRVLSLMLALTLCLGLAVPVQAADGAGFPDTENHYAREAVETWSGHGVLKGYPDGTFQPDGTITRAEMAAVLDRVMGYQNTVENTFTDVPANSWYAQSVLHLAAEGILQGRQEGLMLPNAPITRQEAFAALARSLSLEKSEKAPGFTDDKAIADWALGYVSAMKEAGYIQGDQAGTIRPGDAITRAEVVTILDRMAPGFVNVDGEYSADCKGNLVVNAGNVKLKDMTIDGDLIVADGVGEGDVSIEKVTVKGDIILRGCGENSFHILPGCEVKNIIVTKTTTGRIRVVNESGKGIPMFWVNDGVNGVVVDGDGFNEVIVACDAPVEVKAKTVKTLSVTGNASLTIGKDTTVSSLELTKTAGQASVTVEGKVTELINDAKVSIDNKGTVASSDSSSSGSGFVYYPTSSKKKETLSEVTIQLLAPAFGKIPDKPADPLKAGYSTAVEWQNADGTPATYRWKTPGSTEEDTFTANQAYQAVVKLTPTTGYTFADDLKVTVTDGKEPATEYTPVKSEKSGSNWVVTIQYAATEDKAPIERLYTDTDAASLLVGGTCQVGVTFQDNRLANPATYQYQWYKNGSAIPGGTDKSYAVTAADTAQEGDLSFYCVITINGKEFKSNTRSITVENFGIDPDTIPTPVLRGDKDMTAVYEANVDFLRLEVYPLRTSFLVDENVRYVGEWTLQVKWDDGKEEDIPFGGRDASGDDWSRMTNQLQTKSLYELFGFCEDEKSYYADDLDKTVTIVGGTLTVFPKIKNSKGVFTIELRDKGASISQSFAADNQPRIHFVGPQTQVPEEVEAYRPNADDMGFEITMSDDSSQFGWFPMTGQTAYNDFYVRPEVALETERGEGEWVRECVTMDNSGCPWKFQYWPYAWTREWNFASNKRLETKLYYCDSKGLDAYFFLVVTPSEKVTILQGGNS